MTRKTQIDSWIDLKKHIKGRRADVYRALRIRPMTLVELVSYLDLPINRISGRVTELAKSGVVEPYGQRINPASGKNCIVWRIAELNLI